MKKIILVFLALLFIPLVAGASIDANLYYGLRNNSDVRELQEFLIGKGFINGSATGNFLSLTLKAVKDYQGSVGVSQTGYVGTLTRTAINNELVNQLSASNAESTTEIGTTPPAPIIPATTNDVIATLQAQIALLTQQLQTMMTQQTTVQQLQQTVQQQSQTIQQIQQNTQQIAQNTTSLPIPVPPPTPVSKADLVVTTSPMTYQDKVLPNCVNFDLKGYDKNGDIILHSKNNVKMTSDKAPNNEWYFGAWGNGGAGDTGQNYCAEKGNAGITNFTFKWFDMTKVVTLNMVAPAE